LFPLAQQRLFPGQADPHNLDVCCWAKNARPVGAQGQGVVVDQDFETLEVGNVNGQYDWKDATGLTMNIVDTTALAGGKSLLLQYDKGASYNGGWNFIVGATTGLPGDLTPAGGYGYVEMNWLVKAPRGDQDWLQAGWSGPDYYSVAQFLVSGNWIKNIANAAGVTWPYNWNSGSPNPTAYMARTYPTVDTRGNAIRPDGLYYWTYKSTFANPATGWNDKNNALTFQQWAIPLEWDEVHRVDTTLKISDTLNNGDDVTHTLVKVSDGSVAGTVTGKAWAQFRFEGHWNPADPEKSGGLNSKPQLPSDAVAPLGAFIDMLQIRALNAPTRSADFNLDSDVDVSQPDGTGDAEILTANLDPTGVPALGKFRTIGDANLDADADVFQFDGGGDAQILVSQLPGAGTGQAEATYNTQTGELIFEVSAGVGVVGIEARDNWAIIQESVEPFLSATAVQNDGQVLAYFSASGLPVGKDGVGLCLPVGLTAGDIGFSDTPIGGASTAKAVRVTPEPTDPQLKVAFQGGRVVITWAAGTLVSSPTVTGTYTPIAGATSPYSVTPSPGATFFRIRL
jgi:hypothetical protein